MNTIFLKDLKPGAVYRNNYGDSWLFLVLRNEVAGSNRFGFEYHSFSYLVLTGNGKGRLVLNQVYSGNVSLTAEEFKTGDS